MTESGESLSSSKKYCSVLEKILGIYKGGYSSDASLVFQPWLKDICVYVLECHLSQWEVIQLVKDCTS